MPAHYSTGEFVATRDGAILGGIRHVGVMVNGTPKIVALTGVTEAYDETESLANAQLFAASKSLLSALCTMLREHDAITIGAGGRPGTTDRWPEAAAAARAAIAKATGREA